jgi:hypothetical protein
MQPAPPPPALPATSNLALPFAAPNEIVMSICEASAAGVHTASVPVRLGMQCNEALWVPVPVPAFALRSWKGSRGISEGAAAGTYLPRHEDERHLDHHHCSA